MRRVTKAVLVNMTATTALIVILFLLIMFLLPAFVLIVSGAENDHRGSRRVSCFIMVRGWMWNK